MSLVITIRTEAAVFTSSRFSFFVILIFLVRLPKDFHWPDLSLIRLYRIESQLLPHNVVYYGFTKESTTYMYCSTLLCCTAVQHCRINIVKNIPILESPSESIDILCFRRRVAVDRGRKSKMWLGSTLYLITKRSQTKREHRRVNID